jgi:formylglycine-generating enzyme required for sulfatase activity
MNRLKTQKITFFILASFGGVLLFLWAVQNSVFLLSWWSLRPSFTYIGDNAQGLSEFRHAQTGIVFVLLHGGKYTMGTGDSQVESIVAKLPKEYKSRAKKLLDHERPPHKVTLKPFLMAKHELSQQKWNAVMGDNPACYDEGDHPVENVSWYDCKTFCDKSGLRLPTEAQWEYACRAGTSTLYAFGDCLTIQDCNFLDFKVASKADAAKDRNMTVPVSAFRPNGFGIFNMHGNVAEFCLDYYNETYYKDEKSSIGEIACTAGSEDAVVIRGGCWKSSELLCRCAARSKINPLYKCCLNGFRPVYYPIR